MGKQHQIDKLNKMEGLRFLCSQDTISIPERDNNRGSKKKSKKKVINPLEKYLLKFTVPQYNEKMKEIEEFKALLDLMIDQTINKFTQKKVLLKKSDSNISGQSGIFKEQSISKLSSII